MGNNYCMKKILALIFILICLFLTKSDYCDFVNLYGFPANSEYCLYVGEEPMSKNYINVGTGYIIYDQIQNAKELIKTCNKIYGQSICFEGDMDTYFKLLKDLSVKECFVENVQEIKVFYGFSNKLKDFTIVDEKKVNIQIAFRNGKITVGTPLILGSF